MHPILEEMARAKDIQPHALYRWWSTLAAHISALEAERDQARAELAAVTKGKKGAAA
jgi:transposase-like protein